MKSYEIRVKSTGHYLREFQGDDLLDIYVKAWESAVGEEVVAVNKADKHKADELFQFIRHYINSRRKDTPLFKEALVCRDICDFKRLEEIKHQYTIAIGYELLALGEKHNDGCGVSCVRQIAAELIRNDFKGAKAIAHTDWDKIRNYEDVERFLKQNRIAEDEW